MAFQTAQMPRPQTINRPAMVVVPLERIRPELTLVPARVRMPMPSVEELLAAFKEIPLKSAGGQEVAAAFTKRRARLLVEAIAAKHGVSFEEIIGPRRDRRFVEARWDAIAAVAREFPTWSLPRIGKLFNRDHTSILHAVREMRKRDAA